MTGASDDKRRANRLEHELPVAYRSVGSFLTDWATNISHGGMFINTRRPLGVGTEVRILIQLPSVEFPVRLTGRVTRARVRLGTHVMWSATPWYPNLTTAYGLLSWTEVAADMSAQEILAFAAALQGVRGRMGAFLPEAFGGAGAALITVGAFFLWLGRRTPSIPTSAKAKEVPGFRDRGEEEGGDGPDS